VDGGVSTGEWIQHGTLSGYVHLRCRSDCCRLVWNAYQREYTRTPRGREARRRDRARPSALKVKRERDTIRRYRLRAVVFARDQMVWAAVGSTFHDGR
jgi:hypothetical protein